MKPILFLICVVLLYSSCCRKYYCVFGASTMTMEFKNFDSVELDSATLYVCKKNTQFTTVEEVRKNPNLFHDTTNSIILGGSSYDYALTIKTDTFFVSEIAEVLTHFTSCFGAMPKMGPCQISDDYIIKGKNMSKNGNTIIITK